jgi:16S rRNA (guanine(966)-N(2))-methyltransferase RsmD
MRIIAGKYRGRNLKAGEAFRPTSDRVRETLFNILQSQIENTVFVDAFAGSGAVGIEALSRGASLVFFAETNKKALQILESNLSFCEEGQWRIYTLTVLKALDVVRSASPRVDLLFFDPPYDYDRYSELLSKSASLFPEAEIILETSTRGSVKAPPELKLLKERTIGETRLQFFSGTSENRRI